MGLVVLALGVASCGDSDDEGTAAQQPSGGGDASQDATPVDDSPEGQIRAAHAKYIDIFYEKDPQAICDLLSKKGQQMWAAQRPSCAAGLKAFFGSGVTLSENRPQIVKLRVNGSEALAVAKTKTSNNYPVPMVKENGEWKINTGGAPK